MSKRKLVPFILAVAIIAFGLWVSGFHFEHGAGDFDPRADENSEGQCP